MTDLIAAMAQYGLNPGQIVWDGAMHRFPGKGKKKGNTSGFYRAFTDQRGAIFGDFSQGIDQSNYVKWQANGHKPDEFSPEQWAKMQEEWKEKAAEREREHMEEQLAAAKDCQARWDQAAHATIDHPYAQKKGITDVSGVRQEGKLLLLPMKPIDGSSAIASLQTIDAKGVKLFAEGGRVAATRMTIGDKTFRENPNTPLYICEGWATGATIHQVTGYTVVVCFMGGNLKAVAEYHRKKFPEANIIIAADNDRWTTMHHNGKKDVPNPGFVMGFEAAKAAHALLVLPDFEDLTDEPTDYNDLFRLEGAEAVLRWLVPATIHQVRTLPDAAPAKGVRPEDVPENWTETAPFKCLGFDRGTYWYLPREAGQMVGLTANGHRGEALLAIAPLAWWAQTFPTKQGVDWRVAADALIRKSHRAGVFRPERLRGRGCWPDDQGLILHLGDRLLAPGGAEFIDPEAYTCTAGMIYERQPRLPGPSLERRLDVVEAAGLLDIFRAFNWHDEASADLLAGWTVLAPVCGHLSWRPHVWVVGGSGAGKTTVVKELIVPLLGGMEKYYEGGSTEAGVRQDIRADAIPVVYDEAERTDGKSDTRMQGVISLARSASSTGAATVKGTTHGSALQFVVRSMFCFSSIGGAVRQEADKTRISLLQLKSKSEMDRELRIAHWRALQPKLRLQVNPRVGRELVARTLHWVRTGKLETTLAVFRAAATGILGDARSGDQYGTLLGGAWTLMAEEPPSNEDATLYLKENNVGSYVVEQSPDGLRALQTILQKQERVDSRAGPVTLAVGELIDAARGRTAPIDIEPAKRALARMGIRVDRDQALDYVLVIANKSDWLHDALKETPYCDNLRVALRTIRGAVAGGQTWFISGLNERTTILPFDVIDGLKHGED